MIQTVAATCGAEKSYVARGGCHTAERSAVTHFEPGVPVGGVGVQRVQLARDTDVSGTGRNRRDDVGARDVSASGVLFTTDGYVAAGSGDVAINLGTAVVGCRDTSCATG